MTKRKKDKQRSIKHTYKPKDPVTRTPLKTGGELRCSGRVGSSCPTSDTRHVNLVNMYNNPTVVEISIPAMVSCTRYKLM
jgi:hypothetical protein